MSAVSSLTAQQAQRAIEQGQVYLNAGRPGQALSCFRDAVRVFPNSAPLLGLLADSLQDLGHKDQALKIYAHALKLSPDHLGLLNNYGNALRSVSRFTEAMDVYERALKSAPQHPLILKNLALCFQYENQADKALDYMERARSLAPRSLLYRWYEARVLPITYRDDREIQRYRDHYSAGLDALKTLVSHDTDPKAIWDAFHLHYQGRNDRKLQTKHGELIHQIMSAEYPEYFEPIPKYSQRNTPIRVGFASSMLRDHTITYLFGEWIKGLASRGMEVYGYLIGNRPDDTTNDIAAHCKRFDVLPNDTKPCAKAIRADNLDVLIYPELGMDRNLLKLAALRLAPTQAVTWGHPVTTGLPNIDAFLSSEGMEPAEGQSHYSEQLIKLPALSLYLTKLETPKRENKRSDFGLPNESTLFLIPQSLFKLIPEHDWIYGAIARNLPRAHFCFLANRAAQSTSGAVETVRKRLENAFTVAGQSTDRFTFLPGVSHEEFLDLNACADIFLDAPGWSGGRTTLVALGCGLIPITCPGTLMRQRHTAAILRELGWSDLIADSPTAYVDLATRIGSDRAWRHQLERELPSRVPRLLDRTDVLDALAAFCSDRSRP